MTTLSSFFSPEELTKLGFKSVGENVKISRKASIYSPQTITIGSNVRIDDFCVLSGSITIGSHIHISAYCALYGKFGIELEDYTGISPRTTLFSAMDDFSGEHLIGPIHSEMTTMISGGKISLKKYSQIGTGCIVFPNVTLEEGCVIGAMSLVTKSISAWTIAFGIPAVEKRPRSQALLKFISHNKRL